MKCKPAPRQPPWCRRLAGGLIVAVGTAAQPVEALVMRADNVEAELVAERDGVSAGTSTTVALRLKHEAHWHTYWQVPGDSGLPTRVAWQLPPGFSIGPIQWPVPQRLPVGPLVNYGYEGEVFLLFELQVPAGLPAGKAVELRARADWLICKDVCIPGGANLTLKLPVKAPDALQASRWTAGIAATRGRIPQPITLSRAAADLAGDKIAVRFAPTDSSLRTLAFFPLDEGRIEAAARQDLRTGADEVRLEIKAAAPVAADFKTLRGVIVANGGPGRPEGWAGVVDIPLQR